MIRAASILAAFAFAAVCGAQELAGGTDFSKVRLDRAGVIKGNYKTGRIIESMSGGVKMTFLGETPQQNVELSANQVDFEYSSKEERKPSRITLNGSVTIIVEGNRVDAGSAVFDIDAGMATFTDNPIIDMKDEENSIKLAASIILLNLDTGDFEVRDGQRVHEESD